MAALDVLIPTCDRPTALAITLATLASQRFADFRLHNAANLHHVARRLAPEHLPIEVPSLPVE